MQFLPEFQIGWLNGWIYFVFYLGVFGLTLRTCSPEVRRRLYDRSLWNRKTRNITALGKSFSLANIIMILFGRLQIGHVEFLIGTILYAAGLALLVVSIIHYRDAPLDQPITKGVYKYSRNPQMVSIYILFAGMSLTLGAWLNLLFLGVAVLCSHFSILGEEKALLEQYGESYEHYKEQVPRYFVFF